MDNTKVEIVHFLDDYESDYGGYNCTQWGIAGDPGIPPMVDDGNTANTVFNWFDNPSTTVGGYPLIIFIDHTMTVQNIMGSSPSLSTANLWIDLMLNAMPEMSTSIDDSPYIINNFNIAQLYPNPFNPVLHINFDIALSGVIQVDILDISGSPIKTLHSGFLQSGTHELRWNAESIPSGMYLISLNSGDENLTGKVVLLK